ncbi:MAG: hypothetical protein CM1200mP6_05390 [Anaerolineaceae bacterium]|nr:MAG: hypothetical protein CM1200mP6_05390 [Anaerolineaceae bacterium]
MRYLLAMYIPATILNIFRLLKRWMFNSTNDVSLGPELSSKTCKNIVPIHINLPKFVNLGVYNEQIAFFMMNRTKIQ